MYGKKASELVKEFASSEPGQLAAFNVTLLTVSFNLPLYTKFIAFLTDYE